MTGKKTPSDLHPGIAHLPLFFFIYFILFQTLRSHNGCNLTPQEDTKARISKIIIKSEIKEGGSTMMSTELHTEMGGERRGRERWRKGRTKIKTQKVKSNSPPSTTALLNHILRKLSKPNGRNQTSASFLNAPNIFIQTAF